MNRAMRVDLALALGLLAMAMAVPFFASRYVLGEITLALIYAVVASQWNLLCGVAGVFSLAQIGLFAVGGYITAMLGYYGHWSLWLAMPVAAVGTVAASLVLGIACLRLTGVYVALLTFSASQALYQLIVTDTDCFQVVGSVCRHLTGGAEGLTDFGSLGTRSLFHARWIVADYGLMVALFGITMMFSYALMHSPIGLAFRALRDNASYATSRGVDRFQMQLLVFGMSAFFTGLAGGFYAAHFEAISPNTMSLSHLNLVIAIAVVGGMGRFWAPVIGTVIMTCADELMRDAGQVRLIGLGLVIAVAIVAMPAGVLGLFDRAAKWRRLRIGVSSNPT
jgi:branched-chain amino acid transport system permease protein